MNLDVFDFHIHSQLDHSHLVWFLFHDTRVCIECEKFGCRNCSDQRPRWTKLFPSRTTAYIWEISKSVYGEHERIRANGWLSQFALLLTNRESLVYSLLLSELNLSTIILRVRSLCVRGRHQTACEAKWFAQNTVPKENERIHRHAKHIDVRHADANVVVNARMLDETQRRQRVPFTSNEWIRAADVFVLWYHNTQVIGRRCLFNIMNWCNVYSVAVWTRTQPIHACVCTSNRSRKRQQLICTQERERKSTRISPALFTWAECVGRALALSSAQRRLVSST